MHCMGVKKAARLATMLFPQITNLLWGVITTRNYSLPNPPPMGEGAEELWASYASTRKGYADGSRRLRRHPSVAQATCILNGQKEIATALATLMGIAMLPHPTQALPLSSLDSCGNRERRIPRPPRQRHGNTRQRGIVWRAAEVAQHYAVHSREIGQ